MNRNGRRTRTAIRVLPTPISEKWKQRLGKYLPIEDKADYSTWLEVDDGMLRLAFKEKNRSRKYAYALETIDDDTAITLGIGWNQGKVLRVIKDPENILIDYDGTTLRKESSK